MLQAGPGMRSGGDPAIPARIDRLKTARTCDNLYKNRAIFRSADCRALSNRLSARSAAFFGSCLCLPQAGIDCFPSGLLLQFKEREAVGPGPGQRHGWRQMKILTCNSNRPLAEAISAYLSLPLTRASVRRFSDMEVFVEIQENVRGEDVFVLQSTSYPANDHLMELLVTLDALKRASARRITAVIPYYGYARQDRKSSSRSPISAKLVANLITTAGADRVLTLDLHAAQIQGFFDIPVDNLFASPVLVKDIKENHVKQDLVIVSPDVGGVVRARDIARRVDGDLAIIDKRRERAGHSEVMNIIGDVADRHCILVDDIVDSAGTLCNAAQALIDAGAKAVYAYVTHGVLSGGAVARVAASPIEKLVLTDSIVATEAVRLSHNISQLTIAPLMAEAILRISEERSVSSLFN
jgi:ribose-phosphate pyrophosphokinase